MRSFAEPLTKGNGELVLQRPVANDLDQLGVPENRALDQNRAGDLDFVVGENPDQLVRGVLLQGQAFRQGPANGHFHVVDEIIRDLRHQRPFAFAQMLVPAEQGRGGRRRICRVPVRKVRLCSFSEGRDIWEGLFERLAHKAQP